MEKLDIKNIPVLVVPDNLFQSTEFDMDISKIEEEPQPLEKLGYTEELNNTKKRITPHAEKWEASIRFLLSDFELLDIYRNPRYSHQRYNEPIIKYRSKMETDETKGRYPIFSRAYFKLWEVIGNTDVLANFKEVPLTVANLAEGPGGFIHCLIDYRKKQNGLDWNKDSYYGISLKIGEDGKALDWDWPRAKEYFEYARSKGHKAILSYGGDGTGNMFNVDNLTHFVTKDLDNQKCQLVTGDGGIELSTDKEFDIQELANSPLFFAQILYCFHVQDKGGCFILKIYDVYYNITLQLILLLKLFYEKVSIVKPHTSRPASSEKYLVCEGFKGITDAQLDILKKTLHEWVGKLTVWNGLDKSTFRESVFIFDLKEESMEAFRKELAGFNKGISDAQIARINKGLDLAQKLRITPEAVHEVKKKQRDIAIEWCKDYDMPYDENVVLTTVASKEMTYQKGQQTYDNQRDSRYGSRSRDDRRNPRNDRYKDRDRSRNSRSRSRSPQRKKKPSIAWDPSQKGDDKKLEERKKKFGIE